MTRIAPLMTLAAVAVAGGVLLTTNHLAAEAQETGQQVVSAVPAAASGPEEAAAPAEAAPTAEAPILEAPALEEAPEYSDEYGAPAAPEAAADDNADDTYAGWTRGMDNTVALAVDDDGEISAYVCDGGPFEVWFTGSLDDGELDLTAGGGGTLTGSVDDAGRVFGEIIVGDDRFEFSADAMSVAAASAAGRGDVGALVERAEQD